jgi:hypothetical protein
VEELEGTREERAPSGATRTAGTEVIQALHATPPELLPVLLLLLARLAYEQGAFTSPGAASRAVAALERHLGYAREEPLPEPGGEGRAPVLAGFPAAPLE